MSTLTQPSPTTATPAGDDRPLIVHTAGRGGLPPIGDYLRRLWAARTLAWHLARADLRVSNYDTAFGLVWLLLNPLLLATVYFFLITVLTGGSRPASYLAVITSGIFSYYFTRNTLQLGAKSIVGGGNLITNTSLPRAVLPFSALLFGIATYVPMLGIDAVMHLIFGLPVGPQLLWLPLLLVMQATFGFGVALALAAVTVSVRDVASALPYVLRIWLYMSPILFTIDQVSPGLRPWMLLNPMYDIIGSWQTVVIRGGSPPVDALLAGTAWAIVALVLGGLYFLSRERDFALRI